jgi:hypothetical protein
LLNLGLAENKLLAAIAAVLWALLLKRFGRSTAAHERFDRRRT